ncbi:MAG: hypothetical protein FJ116_04295 [Deltaproteobacteria bacterium]|nr:hypothetical protein [Candidatus Staskawiczbacteria bacterium]MBM4316682.1 hypothetical protein [Deltaproteobacteria bacterium]
MRCFSKDTSTYSFFGFKKALAEQRLYSKFVFLGRKNVDMIGKYLDDSFVDIVDTVNQKWLKDISYTENRYPTSGFFAFHYMKEKFPDSNISLVNFIGTHSGGTGWCGHDFDFEQNYYQTHNINMI